MLCSTVSLKENKQNKSNRVKLPGTNFKKKKEEVVLEKKIYFYTK